MRGDVPVNRKTLLMTNFINFKIKSTQSFESAHKNIMCMSNYIYIMFLK
jgi:hypothetical protein